VPRRYFPTFERIWAIKEYIPQCKRILDLGCGDGIYLPYLSKRAEMVVGLDLSAERIRKAKGAYPFLLLGDVTQLPFRDDAFDVVWASEIIEHTSVHRIFREIERVAKRVVATMPNPAGPILLGDIDHIFHMKYTRSSLSRFLEQRKWRYEMEGLGLCLPYLPVPKVIKKAFLGLSRKHIWLSFTILIRGEKCGQN